jgi:hypothetical protein
MAAVKAGSDVADERGFGFVGMDTKGFGRQNLAPVGGAPPPSLLRKVFHRCDLASYFEARWLIFSCKVFQAKKLTLPDMGLFFDAGFHSSG